MQDVFPEVNVMEATISEIHAHMAAGKLSCRQLVEFYIARIEAYDQKGPKINSVIQVNARALETADFLDRQFQASGLTGPLHGIPVLLKDNVDAAGMATTAGSLCLAGVMPGADAWINQKMKAAGAVILAKVNLHELAVWGETASSLLGQTLNPYDLTRTPGGSSGGTGAGIAANFGMIGIGTDTVNSVRSPASACSLVGLRPTVGLISRNGIVPYSRTQDTAGPITRTVEDAVKVLEVMRGYDPADPATAWGIRQAVDSYARHCSADGLQGKRIGVLHSLFGQEAVHREVNETISNRLEDLKNHGASLVAIREEIDADRLVGEVSVHLHELKRDLNQYLAELGEQSRVHSLAEIIQSGTFHESIEASLRTAQRLETDTPEYCHRLVKRQVLRNRLVELMARHGLDAVVFPHQKRPVVKTGESQVDRNGVVAAVTGFPGCVLPAGFTTPTEDAPLGIPVGIEFLTREWDEATLIEVAYGYEQATKCRRPPVSVPPL